MPNSIGMIIKKNKETCPAAKQHSLKPGSAFSKLPHKCLVGEWSVAKYGAAEARCLGWLFSCYKQGDNTVAVILCYAWVFRPARRL